MYFVSMLSALSVAALTAAQTNVVVQVGSTSGAPGGVFQYIPNTVTAKNGDTVTFRFTGAPGNHTVTQSSFAAPCDPLSGGFDSGWIFIPASNVSQSPEWTLTITDDTKPIWFYCKQLQPAPHCVAGMVGAINPPTTGSNTMDAFVNAARAFNGAPGQGSGGSLSGVGATASGAPGPIASGAQAFGTPSGSAQTTSQATTASITSTHPPTTTGTSTTSASGNRNGAISVLSIKPFSVALVGFGLAMGMMNV